MKTKKVLTCGDVARLCNVDFHTVQGWIAGGMLEAHTLSGRSDSRIHLDDFLEFVATTQTPMPEDFAPNKRRILVVDDEARMARSIKRILKRAGYDVRTANDGLKAGTYLGTFSPALVTLDLQMPGFAGDDVLSFIRQTAGLEQVRVLVVSGLNESDLDRALAAGADAVLPKPFENQQLVDAVGQLLDPQWQADNAALV